MKRLLAGLALLMAVVACRDVTAPDDPLPDLRPGDGVLRFTLSAACPNPLTIAFGLDIFWYGPERLAPGESMDYQEPARLYVTRGRTEPASAITFPPENTLVVAGQRVTRVLSC